MPYIGKAPIDRTLGLSQKNAFTGDGSTTSFDMSSAAPEGGDTAVDVFVDNVRQEPGSGKAYILASDGTDFKRITFSTAPASGAVIWTNNRLRTQVTNILPGSGTIIADLLATNSVTNIKVADDAIGVAELSATGTASSSTFLRGDNAWTAIAGDIESVTAGTGLNGGGSTGAVTLNVDTTLNSVTAMTSLVTVGTIGTGTWQGTAVANAYIAAGVDAVKLADGTVTNAEFQYINTLSSNAQTQITNTVTVANAALPKAGGTMSGDLNMADQEILRPILRDYVEPRTNMAAAATVTLDMTNGNVFALTPDQNTTFVFSNPGPANNSTAFTLIWTQDSSDRTITWPASVDWAGGSAPDVTSGSGKRDVYTFFSLDEGTIWYGFQAGADMS